MSAKLKPWLVLAVIFIAGILTGVALTMVVGPHFRHPLGPPHDMKKSWLTFLTHELDLTPDQQAKIQPILADATTQLQAVHHDEMQHGAQIFKTVHDQISAILTPDQQAKLQKLESERQKMFSGHLHPWGGPGGGSHHDGPDGVAPPPAPPPPAPGQPPPSPQGAPSSSTPMSAPPMELPPRPTTD